MKQETISVLAWSSGRVKNVGVVISLRRISDTDCDAVIGYPGLQNVIQTMKIGDAALYETTHDGVIEVRAIALYPSRVEFLVTQVAPRVGFVAGAVDTDPNNAPFTESELRQIEQSVAVVKRDLAIRKDILPEQIALIGRKLDEIQAAAGRMGRKDWMNYVAGTLTSICISAAFASEVAKAIYMLVNTAFSWLFANGPLLLQRL